MTNEANLNQSDDRLVIWGTILGIVLFWVITTVHGILIEGYSHVDYALSALGMKGTPYAFVSRTAFILLGTSMLAFSWVIRQRSKGSQTASMVSMVLLFVHGIGRIGEGVFPWNLEVPDAVSNQLHNLFGFLGLFVLIFIPFSVDWAFRNMHHWLLRVFTWVMGILYLTVFITSVFGPNLGLAIPLGLGQRIGLAVWYVWLLVLSNHFLRHPASVPA